MSAGLGQHANEVDKRSIGRADFARACELLEGLCRARRGCHLERDQQGHSCIGGNVHSVRDV
jgi:hypothetical protein